MNPVDFRLKSLGIYVKPFYSREEIVSATAALYAEQQKLNEELRRLYARSPHIKIVDLSKEKGFPCYEVHLRDVPPFSTEEEAEVWALKHGCYQGNIPYDD